MVSGSAVALPAGSWFFGVPPPAGSAIAGVANSVTVVVSASGSATTVLMTVGLHRFQFCGNEFRSLATIGSGSRLAWGAFFLDRHFHRFGIAQVRRDACRVPKWHVKEAEIAPIHPRSYSQPRAAFRLSPAAKATSRNGNPSRTRRGQFERPAGFPGRCPETPRHRACRLRRSQLRVLERSLWAVTMASSILVRSGEDSRNEGPNR